MQQQHQQQSSSSDSSMCRRWHPTGAPVGSPYTQRTCSTTAHPPCFSSAFTCYPPSTLMLQAPGVPAGLRNLGNTCYVNAAMQFLHSLPAFRNALYKLEPELAEQQIVKQMR